MFNFAYKRPKYADVGGVKKIECSLWMASNVNELVNEFVDSITGMYNKL